MRTLRVTVVLAAVVAATMALAPAASAGGWAATYLDPLPDKVESGRTYTVGYWVLQHGTHPSEMDLGETALRLVDEQGKAVTFKGTALPESGHYATAWSIPHDGEWRVFGVQGPFQEHMVGTLTVPGSIKLAPLPTGGPAVGNVRAIWGDIRPPLELIGMEGFGEKPATEPASQAAPPAPAPAAARSGVPAAEDAGSSVLGPVLLAVAGLAAAAFALVATRRRWNWRLGTPRT